MDVYLPPLLDVLHGLTVDLGRLDRKSTRLNSSHLVISYAVFCLKKKKKHHLTFSTQLMLRSLPKTPTTYPCSHLLARSRRCILPVHTPHTYLSDDYSLTSHSALT